MRRILMTGAALLLTASGVQAAEQTLSEEHRRVLDLDGDGVVHEVELQRFVQNSFTEMDKDGDDFVDRAEATTVLTPEQFDAADRNRDGKLSLQEMQTQARADFRQADKDGDGQLH